MREKKFSNLFFKKYWEDDKILSDSKIQIPKGSTIAEIDNTLLDTKEKDSNLEKKLERVLKKVN
jgi:hypothetical protein